MLVLTRKIGEGIVLGDDIRVTVVDVKGGSVRLGIDAPTEVKIYRQEVYDRIGQENQDAAQWDISDLGALSSLFGGEKEQ